jgi:MinD superfamily P-loop ATPase
MKRAIIDPQRCHNCQPCAVKEQCPMTAVFIELPGDRPWVDFYRCSGCLRCQALCPHGAIQEISHPCDGRPRLGW